MAEVTMRRMFGTDGVRDIANKGNMTPEAAMNLGRAFVEYLEKKGHSNPSVLVGRDSRLSGPMVESAIISGMVSVGASVHTLGVFPTAGVSHMLGGGGYSGGAVISASHNPAEYNGIKFFAADGYKLSDEDELLIEGLIWGHDFHAPTGSGIGGVVCAKGATEEYAEWLLSSYPDWQCGYRIVMDCANGAACAPARIIAGQCDNVKLIACEPDGLNINNRCGVMHMENVSRATVEHGAHVGISFDGDADRVLMCDSKGRVIDGDVILWVLSMWLKKMDKHGGGTVATVMSNMVLEEKLAKAGVPVFRCDVGDRYVLMTMKENGCRLGGEQSGHIIAADWVTTGDGICTGMLFLRACRELDIDISGLVDQFVPYPQILRNIHVNNKNRAMESDVLREAIERGSAEIAGLGRILVRPSGTEPMVRVLVECRDRPLMERVAGYIANAVELA